MPFRQSHGPQVVQANGRYLMSMTEILQRIAEGADVEAFRKLFEAYAPRVKTYMMRQGADANTAEELAQETLLTVWRKAALYSGEKGSATTWIFTIAHNLKSTSCVERWRGSRCLTGYDQEVSHDANPDEALAEQERRTRIQQALAELPPNTARGCRSLIRRRPVAR